MTSAFVITYNLPFRALRKSPWLKRFNVRFRSVKLAHQWIDGKGWLRDSIIAEPITTNHPVWSQFGHNGVSLSTHFHAVSGLCSFRSSIVLNSTWSCNLQPSLPINIGSFEIYDKQTWRWSPITRSVTNELQWISCSKVRETHDKELQASINEANNIETKSMKNT